MKKRADGRYQKSITINGKRTVFYGKNIAELNRKIIEYREKEKNGKSFFEVCDEWEKEHFENLEYTTKVRYNTPIEYAKKEFKNVYINDITPDDVDLYIKKCVSKGYSSKSVKMFFSVLGMIFKHAYIKRYIKVNPCLYLTIPSNLPKSSRKPLTKEEIKIVNKSIDKTFGFFAYFLLYTGLRRGEALALMYEDIDFENKEINVNKSVYYESNTPKIKTPKTESGNRKVILIDCLSKCIQKGKNGYIFCNDDGTLLGNSKVTRYWTKYKEETGLDITPHQLRHTYASILFDAGISDKDAQDLMGHSDITITKNIYVHISKERKKKTAETLNDYVVKM